MARKSAVLVAILLMSGPPPALAADDDEGTVEAPRYEIESIRIEGNDKTKDFVIRRVLMVAPGMRISVDDPRFEVSRIRVLSLGYFSDVRLTLQKGSERGRVVLVVEVVERGTIVLTSIFLGTSEATTAWGGLGAAENNLLGRGISLEGAFVLGSDPEVERGDLQQSYLLRLGMRQVGGLNMAVGASFRYVEGSEFFRRAGPESSSDPADFLSIRYRRIGGTLGFGFGIGRFLRLYVDYRGEAITSDHPAGAVRRDPAGGGEPIDFGIRDGDSILSAVHVQLELDTRSDPVLPHSGKLLQLEGVASSGFIGSTYDYFKLTARYEHFFPLRWGHVVSVEGIGGVVFGGAPFFERYFIGDYNDLVPGRALGLNFSTLPSRDVFGTSIDSMRYEEFVARTSVEYVIPWFRGGTYAYGGDFFVNVGVLLMTSRQELRMRDRSLSESIPVDLTVDAGLRLDTFIGIFKLSVGNLLGRIPF